MEILREIHTFLTNGELPSEDERRRRIRRMASNYRLRGNKLFYTGPSLQYMRRVVMSNEEKESVLTECHLNRVTGKHNGARKTRDSVTARYYWLSLHHDVGEWVRRCVQCQKANTIMPTVQESQCTKVKEPWEVLAMHLIGPLPETCFGNRYILTMTDLYTKWVVAEPLKSKDPAEAFVIITSKLYTFGMVRKIISDQGKEFVDQLNESLYSAMNTRDIVSRAYHPQINGQNARTNGNIKSALKKYVNENHDDWDVYLAAVVYGINTAKQSSTRHSPFYLLFHRHPHLPTVMNVCPMDDDFEVANPDDDIDSKMAEVAAVQSLPQLSKGRRDESNAAVLHMVSCSSPQEEEVPSTSMQDVCDL